MAKSDIIAASKEKYQKLKSENVLSVRKSHSQDITQRPLYLECVNAVETFVKDGKTVTPIDLMEIIQKSGVDMDFGHATDIASRMIRIVLAKQKNPEINISRIYGTETTEIINREIPLNCFKKESNAERNVSFLTIDLN